MPAPGGTWLNPNVSQRPAAHAGWFPGPTSSHLHRSLYRERRSSEPSLAASSWADEAQVMERRQVAKGSRGLCRLSIASAQLQCLQEHTHGARALSQSPQQVKAQQSLRLQVCITSPTSSPSSPTLIASSQHLLPIPQPQSHWVSSFLNSNKGSIIITISGRKQNGHCKLQDGLQQSSWSRNDAQSYKPEQILAAKDRQASPGEAEAPGSALGPHQHPHILQLLRLALPN